MKALKDDLAKKKIMPCYLYVGNEGYLKTIYTERLTNILLDESAKMMNLTIFEGPKASIQEILDIAETTPFLAEKRLVMIKGSQLFGNRKEDSEQLASFLTRLPESTCILFVEEEVDKRGKLYKAIVKIGTVAEFKPLTESDLIRFVLSELKKGQVSGTTKEALYFLRWVGQDMKTIVAEAEKLSGYLGKGSILEKEAIEAVCTKSLESKIFDLVGALGNHKPQEAISIYHNLLMLKESPLMVLAMIIRQFRLIFQCKLLVEEGLPQNAIAQKIGTRDFVVRGCLQQGKAFSLDGLKKAMATCLDTDVAIKTGRISGELGVELLLLEYAK